MMDEAISPGTQIPVRVVLNNNTVTAFSGFKFSDLRKSFVLSKASFSSTSKYKNCFIISQTDKHSATFCDFGMNSSPEFFAEWHYDFNLFKFQCAARKPSVNIANATDLEEQVQKLKQQMKVDILMKKKKEEKEQEVPLLIKKEGDIALKALSKELDIEKSLELEELQREEEESTALDYQINLEKKKEECIVKAIQEREKESQFNLRQELKAEELDHLQSAAKKQITIRRDYLRKKLLNLRDKAKKKNDIKNSQIMSIRMEVAGTIANSLRKGLISHCVRALSSPQNWEAYCNGFFNSDLSYMNTCLKETEKKCEICCEREFGDVYPADRKKCEDETCIKEVSKDTTGRWIWKKDE